MAAVALRIPFRYNRYLFALDFFGILSLLLVIGYMLFSPKIAAPSHIDSMVANVLSELVGIWVAVRAIEFLTHMNEAHDRVRVRTVRNIRMLERLVSNVLIYKSGAEVIALRREKKWVDSLRPKRVHHFSRDELRDLEAFHKLIDDFCEQVNDFDLILDRRQVKLADESKAGAIYLEIETARESAEVNILEETEEDKGTF